MARELEEGAIPIEVAMREMATWLERFVGERVLVTSSAAFWHILYHMSATVEERGLPFSMFPIDITSFCAGAAGELKTHTALRYVSPASAMKERIATIAKAVEASKEYRW
jgi:hypothetical protein